MADHALLMRFGRVAADILRQLAARQAEDGDRLRALAGAFEAGSKRIETLVAGRDAAETISPQPESGPQS